MEREDVQLSDAQLRDHFEGWLRDTGFAGSVERLDLTFDGDMDGELALFITAIVDENAVYVEPDRLDELHHSLHDAARQLRPGVMWYVWITDDTAVSDDPPA